MPRQSFPISFLIHPDNYEKATEALVPFSFSSSRDKEGNTFSFNPLSMYESIKMPHPLMADKAGIVGDIRADVRTVEKLTIHKGNVMNQIDSYSYASSSDLEGVLMTDREEAVVPDRGASVTFKHRMYERFIKGSTLIRKFYTLERRTSHFAQAAAKSLTAIVEERGAVLERKRLQAEQIESRESVLPDIISAEVGDIEGIVQDSIIAMDKHDILSSFLDLIEMEKGEDNEAEMLSSILSDAKTARDSLIDTNVLSSERAEYDSLWIDRMIVAMQSEQKDSLITQIKSFDALTKESLIESLNIAGVPGTKEGLAEELKLAWNHDKDNRPAGILQTQTAIWDIGMDDVLGVWDPGWDYLDVPDRDTDYASAIKPEHIHDKFGVPHNPIGPTNLPDVKIKAVPLRHPFPEWKDVGKEEQWVDLFTFQDVLIYIVGLQRRELSKFAGMDSHQTLRYVIEGLEQNLKITTPWAKEHQRMFRFVRWYAEMLMNRFSYSILHRDYGSWVADIHTYRQDYIQRGSLYNFDTYSNGLIESNSVNGHLQINSRNYIDGELKFSAAIVSSNPSSQSKLDFYIDNKLVQTVTASSGVQQWTHTIDSGEHYFKWEYTCDVGDLVRLSGIQLDGVVFNSAYTTFHPDENAKGPEVLEHLIQMLLGYYKRHHQGKQKGAMSIKQRKIWLF